MSAGHASLEHEPHDHVANFYASDADLVHAVIEFAAGGVRADEAVILVAERDHLAAIVDGVGDAVGALDPARLICLDAAATLSAFMVDGHPDPARFDAVIGGAVARAATGGRHVRAFGEMVALLWTSGNVTGAIELEGLWNELAVRWAFSLYCGYPMDTIDATGDLEATQRICAQHSRLLAPRVAQWSVPGADARRRHSRVFVPTADTVRAARVFTSETLEGWELGEQVADATIVVSELATNAIRHAESAYRVELERLPSTVRITVHDTSPSLPEAQSPHSTTEGGRGIAIVGHLTERFGVEASAVGKAVWAELAISPS